MTTPTLKLPLALVQPGMKLGEPAKLESGMVALAAGAELGEATLAKLRGMGVKAVGVVPQGEWLVELSNDPVCKTESRRLVHMFRHFGTDPWMRKVRGVLLVTKALAAHSEAGGRE